VDNHDYELQGPHPDAWQAQEGIYEQGLKEWGGN